MILVCKKVQKETQSEFVTKSVGMIVTIIFLYIYREIITVKTATLDKKLFFSIKR